MKYYTFNGLNYSTKEAAEEAKRHLTEQVQAVLIHVQRSPCFCGESVRAMQQIAKSIQSGSIVSEKIHIVFEDDQEASK